MLDRLWADFQEQTQSYRKTTEERKIRFETLKKKDEESANTIAKQMKKIQRLQVRMAIETQYENSRAAHCIRMLLFVMRWSLS